jgi:hypothetical protein
MFGFDTRHADALPWDGRGMRSGTITYIDDECVEQYVGQQKWIAYGLDELGAFEGEVGDQLRISRRGTGVAIEAIGPNRLDGEAAANGREVSSGMFVLRVTDFSAEEVESTAGAVAERYSAKLLAGDLGLVLEFRAAARLEIMPQAVDAFAHVDESGVLREPVAGALRLTVSVRSDKLEAAAEAEHALVLFAAMVTSDAEALALDDTGAIFSSEGLYGLGTRNEMRADAFAFAAAAAKRQWPAPHFSISARPAIYDELTVYSSRPWRADFAARFIEREVDALVQAANDNDDPVVCEEGDFVAPDERGAAGELERLMILSYETVEVEIGFVVGTCIDDRLRSSFDGRKDVEALLGRPIASAVVFTIAPRDPHAESDVSALELRRAETVVTALAAMIAGRGEAVAADVSGAVYAADDLLRAALRRSGKSASWNARAASLDVRSAFSPGRDLVTELERR